MASSMSRLRWVGAGVFGESQRATDRSSPGTVYTFVIGGKAPLPQFGKYEQGELLSGVPYDKKDVAPGGALYVSNCLFCHGVPGVDKGGNLPNLGYAPREAIANLEAFVFEGAMAEQGMPDFKGKLTAEDVKKLKAFIQGTADSVRGQPAASAKPKK